MCFQGHTIHNIQGTESAKMSIHRILKKKKKEKMVHLCTGTILGHTTEGNNAPDRRVDGWRDYHDK